MCRSRKRLPTPSRALTPGVHAEAEVSDEPRALRVGEENGEQRTRQNAELDNEQPVLRRAASLVSTVRVSRACPCKVKTKAKKVVHNVQYTYIGGKMPKSVMPDPFEPKSGT